MAAARRWALALGGILGCGPHERFPDAVLGCTQPGSGDVVVLDPSGGAPPRTLALAPAWEGWWTDHGIVGFLEESDTQSKLIYVREVESGAETRLADVRGLFAGVSDDGVLVRVGDLVSDTAEPALWRLPIDGSPAQQLARRTDYGMRFIADRIVTPVAVDDSQLGELVVVGPDSLAERPLDERVLVYMSWLYEEDLGERHVIHSVIDGARSGVWLARLAE